MDYFESPFRSPELTRRLKFCYRKYNNNNMIVMLKYYFVHSPISVSTTRSSCGVEFDFRATEVPLNRVMADAVSKMLFQIGIIIILIIINE